MIETYFQVSCNGCGDTLYSDDGFMPLKEWKSSLTKEGGWKFKRKDLAYCSVCVNAKKDKTNENIYV